MTILSAILLEYYLISYFPWIFTILSVILLEYWQSSVIRYSPWILTILSVILLEYLQSSLLFVILLEYLQSSLLFVSLLEYLQSSLLFSLNIDNLFFYSPWTMRIICPFLLEYWQSSSWILTIPSIILLEYLHPPLTILSTILFVYFGPIEDQF